MVLFDMLPYICSLVRCVIDSLMCIAQLQLLLCCCHICSCHKNQYKSLHFQEYPPSLCSIPHPLQFLCTVVAILLHYFFMSTFAWMFVEGLHIYRMQTEQRNINYGAMRFYYAIGWGVPAIITGESQTRGWGCYLLTPVHSYTCSHIHIHTEETVSLDVVTRDLTSSCFRLALVAF